MDMLFSCVLGKKLVFFKSPKTPFLPLAPKGQKDNLKVEKLRLKPQKLELSAIQLSGVGWICSPKKPDGSRNEYFSTNKCSQFLAIKETCIGTFDFDLL